MLASVNLFSTKENEINKFLESFYQKKVDTNDLLSWSKEYNNPVEIADIIGCFVDNNYKYQLGMWISLDPGVLINITDYNADLIIRYLFERFPY